MRCILVANMRKPRYRWWGYVKSAMAACANPRHPKHKVMSESVCAAWARVDAGLDEPRRQLADMVLVKRTHTIVGAALQLHISEPTARRWHREVIIDMAREMKIDTQEPFI